MSRHLIYMRYNNKPIYVLIGWNGAMQGYFMVINYINNLQNMPLFSNIHLNPPYPSSIEIFLDILEREFKLFLPDAILVEILRDVRQNIGDKDVVHLIVNGCHQRQESVIDTLNEQIFSLVEKYQNAPFDTRGGSEVDRLNSVLGYLSE